MDEVLAFTLGIAALLGFVVLAYLVSNNKLKPSWHRPAKTIVITVSLGIVLAMVALLMFAAYRSADRRGWFAHERTASVWMAEDWLVGEFKQCVLSNGARMPLLDCSVGGSSAAHEMNVEFHGSLDALELKKQSEWKCQRKDQSISCANK